MAGYLQRDKTDTAIMIRIINVMASSVDGYVAVHSGQTDAERHEQGFSSDADWQRLKEQLTQADAVILGAKTMSTANGAVDQRRHDGTYPVWITFTNSGIAHDNAFWRQTHIPRWIVSREPLVMHDASVRNLVYREQDPVEFVTGVLEECGYRQTLLFGGGTVNRMFYEAGAVDELHLTVCPLIVGSPDGVPLIESGLSNVTKLTLKSVEPHGDLLFVRYLVNKK
jgi:5-amino-6-(5-phosphoribosylamino)uracil reductase